MSPSMGALPSQTSVAQLLPPSPVGARTPEHNQGSAQSWHTVGICLWSM